jgi:hypothetical protein
MTDDTNDPIANRPRDYKPGPGRVTVLRERVSQHYVKDETVDIAKAIPYAEMEEVFSIFAVVARVGDSAPGGMQPWFTKGDVVTIQHSLFDEVQISPNLSVWNGPYAAITGVFVEPETEN